MAAPDALGTFLKNEVVRFAAAIIQAGGGPSVSMMRLSRSCSQAPAGPNNDNKTPQLSEDWRPTGQVIVSEKTLLLVQWITLSCDWHANHSRYALILMTKQIDS